MGFLSIRRNHRFRTRVYIVIIKQLISRIVCIGFAEKYGLCLHSSNSGISFASLNRKFDTERWDYHRRKPDYLRTIHIVGGLLFYYCNMEKRVVILIDGQNLYYGLKHLGIVERNIYWDKLFKSLLQPEDELVRTYWFRPQKILDSAYTAEGIRNFIVYKKYRSSLNDYKTDKSKIAAATLVAIETEALKAEEWLKKEKTRFAQIEFNYDKLSLEFGDIEFVKTGVVKVNPYDGEYVGEKGVDISLAVKMISLSVEKKCDKIILISGDYDYAEALKFVKNNMTKVHLVKLHKGFPPKNKNVSRDLAILADKVLDVYEAQIRADFYRP